MFPAWIKPALLRVGILAAACVVLFVGVKIVSGSMNKRVEDAPQVADDGSAKDAAPPKVVPVVAPEPTAKTPEKQAAPTVADVKKTTVPTEVKINKLLTLYEAVGLFEKSGKGEVVYAEKIGTADKAAFNLDVIGAKGKQRFNVNATGKVIVEVPITTIATKKGPGSGKTSDRKKGGAREREREMEREREGR